LKSGLFVFSHARVRPLMYPEQNPSDMLNEKPG
jgi:hypothetical protein